MTSTPSPARPGSWWLRVLLLVAVAVGIIAMHQGFTADHTNHATSTHAGSTHAGHPATHGDTALPALTAPAGEHGHDLMADCCNALMTCLAMMIAIGTALLLSGRRTGGVIGRLRAVMVIALPPPIPPVGIPIRLRTTILRC